MLYGASAFLGVVYFCDWAVVAKYIPFWKKRYEHDTLYPTWYGAYDPPLVIQQAAQKEDEE
jgi:hypothetical protein